MTTGGAEEEGPQSPAQAWEAWTQTGVEAGAAHPGPASGARTSPSAEEAQASKA